MGRSTYGIPIEVRKVFSEDERFENVFHSYIGWVADAKKGLQGMDEDEIKLLSPVLDKLSRSMYQATKDLYGSEKELSPKSSEIDDTIEALNLAATTFYRNRYSDLDYIGNDLNSEKISGLEGANLLTDAFLGFESLRDKERQEIQNLADSVLRGVYEATKILYSSDWQNDDAYRDALENIVNVFGSELKNSGR